MTAEPPPHTGPWFRSRSGLVLLAFLAIAGFFLVTEHAAHVVGVLPWLLLLACPLLHFLHGGHGGGHEERGGRAPREGGFVLLAAAWRALYAAQLSHQLAITGPYAHVRHPQYVGFILVMLGFLFQWPTLITLVMFPILVWMYVRLARREEREVRAAFGAVYAHYAERVPRFIPRLGGRLEQRL